MTPLPARLDDRQLFDWLRLTRSENVGPRTFLALLQRFGSAGAALAALPAFARRPGARPVTAAPAREIEAELDAARRAGLHLLPLCDPAYPAALRAIDAPPPLLMVRGQLAALGRPMAAIVGSRNASGAGLIVTERLAQGLGQAGFVVVSGLARGIDARAHRASLPTGTIAVLAGGHDRIYPSDHAGLAAQIAADGAVISEMPISWEPRGRDFPRRNRIVSGLALATVVVEAARRSGSLITARFANEQGRAVFAVPGHPLDPRAEGTNDLIRQGATLCTGAEHVLEVLGPMAGNGPAFAVQEMASRGAGSPFWDEAELLGPPAATAFEGHAEPADSPAATSRERVAELIGAAPISVDELVREAALPASMVQGLLIELEMEGRLVRHGTGAVSKLPA